jgi:hypothetical protein
LTTDRKPRCSFYVLRNKVIVNANRKPQTSTNHPRTPPACDGVPMPPRCYPPLQASGLPVSAGDVVGGSAASIRSVGGSAQRWRVSRNGAHRREKEDNGRRREQIPNMHSPPAAAHLCFFAPTAPRTIPRNFARKISRNLQLNPRLHHSASSAGGTSIKSTNQQINNSTFLLLPVGFRPTS